MIWFISTIHTFVNIPALIRKRNVFLSSRAGMFTKVWIGDELIVITNYVKFLIFSKIWPRTNWKNFGLTCLGLLLSFDHTAIGLLSNQIEILKLSGHSNRTKDFFREVQATFNDLYLVNKNFTTNMYFESKNKIVRIFFSLN
jgi:hypothetical protein